MAGAYLAFLNAQLFHWSGILALIGCGLVQQRYGFSNLSREGRSTVHLGVQSLAAHAEHAVFLILGYKFSSGLLFKLASLYDLILVSIALCLAFR